MEYDNESTYIVGSLRNILALRRLFDQLGAGERALDIAKTLDSHYITYDELMSNHERLAMERNTYLCKVEGLNNRRWHIDYKPTPRYVWATAPQP